MGPIGKPCEQSGGGGPPDIASIMVSACEIATLRILISAFIIAAVCFWINLSHATTRCGMCVWMGFDAGVGFVARGIGRAMRCYVCVRYACFVSWLCVRYACFISWLCVRFARFVSWLCVRFARFVSWLCVRFARFVSWLCVRFARSYLGCAFDSLVSYLGCAFDTPVSILGCACDVPLFFPHVFSLFFTNHLSYILQKRTMYVSVGIPSFLARFFSGWFDFTAARFKGCCYLARECCCAAENGEVVFEIIVEHFGMIFVFNYDAALTHESGFLWFV